MKSFLIAMLSCLVATGCVCNGTVITFNCLVDPGSARQALGDGFNLDAVYTVTVPTVTVTVSDAGVDAQIDVVDAVDVVDATDVVDASDIVDASDVVDAADAVDASDVTWLVSDAAPWPTDAYEDFAKLVRTPTGKIYDFYRLSTAHSGVVSPIVSRVSTDDGATWSAPTTLLSAPNVDYREVAGGVNPATGTIVLATWIGSPPGTTLAVYTTRSTDDGVTWSPLAQVTSAYLNRAHGGLVLLPGGDLGIMMAAGLSPGVLEYLVVSHDDGQTWPDARPLHPTWVNVPPPSTGNLNIIYNHEIGAQYFPGVGIIAVGRGRLALPDATTSPIVYTSTDLGMTWSARTSGVQPTPLGLALDGSQLTMANWEVVSPWVVTPGLGGSGTATWLMWERENPSTCCYLRGLLRAVTATPAAVMADPTVLAGTSIWWSGHFIDSGYESMVPIANGFLVQFMTELSPGGPENQDWLTVTHSP